MCDRFVECIELYDMHEYAVLRIGCVFSSPFRTKHFTGEAYREVRKTMSRHGRRKFTCGGSKPFREIEEKFKESFGMLRDAVFCDGEPESCDFPLDKLLEKWNDEA